MSEYRNWLVAAEQKSQESFDRTVLTLSGGALGISFIFLKDVVGDNPIERPDLLLLSWVTWAASVTCVLASFFCSHLSLRRAISQVDNKTIHNAKAGGWSAMTTLVLNALGGVLFLAGVGLIASFASVNVPTKEKGTNNVIQAPAVQSTPTDEPDPTATAIPADTHKP